MTNLVALGLAAFGSHQSEWLPRLGFADICLHEDAEGAHRNVSDDNIAYDCWLLLAVDGCC